MKTQIDLQHQDSHMNYKKNGNKIKGREILRDKQVELVIQMIWFWLQRPHFRRKTELGITVVQHLKMLETKILT